MRMLRIFRRQTPGLKRQLLESWWTLLLVRLRLLFSSGRLESWTTFAMTDPGPRRSSARGPVSESELLWTVRAAARLVPRATCLTQVLAARRLLARRGIDAQIRIGVRRTSNGIDAHGWVERPDGTLLFDPGDRREYTPLEPAPRS